MLLFNVAIKAQGTAVENQALIQDPIHNSNIGKIAFTAKPVKLTELGNAQFLNDYELTSKSNLFITVFLGNTMTSYLKQLAPTLDSNILLQSGNYQFSFYVDQKLVYQSNLLPGAPRANEQNTFTV